MDFDLDLNISIESPLTINLPHKFTSEVHFFLIKSHTRTAHRTSYNKQVSDTRYYQLFFFFFTRYYKLPF